MINLQATYGQTYRVTHEEGHTGRNSDPWLQIIPCRHGHIFVWSATQLAFSSDRRGPVANRVARIGQIVQDGDDGLTVAFPPDEFDRVAEIVKPRRRRRLSAEQRERLAARGRQALESYREGAA